MGNLASYFLQTKKKTNNVIITQHPFFNSFDSSILLPKDEKSPLTPEKFNRTKFKSEILDTSVNSTPNLNKDLPILTQSHSSGNFPSNKLSFSVPLRIQLMGTKLVVHINELTTLGYLLSQLRSIYSCLKIPVEQLKCYIVYASLSNARNTGSTLLLNTINVGVEDKIFDAMESIGVVGFKTLVKRVRLVIETRDKQAVSAEQEKVVAKVVEQKKTSLKSSMSLKRLTRNLTMSRKPRKAQVKRVKRIEVYLLHRLTETARCNKIFLSEKDTVNDAVKLLFPQEGQVECWLFDALKLKWVRMLRSDEKILDVEDKFKLFFVY